MYSQYTRIYTTKSVVTSSKYSPQWDFFQCILQNHFGCQKKKAIGGGIAYDLYSSYLSGT
jgi:hypothetical protein